MIKVHNSWLSERSKLLAKYAERIPKKARYVQVSLDPSKYGWIDMHLSVNNNGKCYLT